MSAEYKKPPLAPKPNILSHLSSKLPSSLMSRPRASARGPKPPVAPKPQVLHAPGETCSLDDQDSLSGCSNGDLQFSEEEPDQGNESEGSLPEGDGADEQQPTLAQEGCDSAESGGEERDTDSEEEASADPTKMEGTYSMDTPEVSDTECSADSAYAAEVTDAECTGDEEPEIPNTVCSECDAVPEDTGVFSECDAASGDEGTDHHPHIEDDPEDLSLETESPTEDSSVNPEDPVQELQSQDYGASIPESVIEDPESGGSSDTSDKQKKKKSSFKRFLTLKFRRKTENKVHVDVNVSSSRSSSESSHHGPLRVLDMDRRSIGSSPHLKVRSGKPQRLSDSPTTFLFYKDGKRKGGPKTFSNRCVSRVESFEDRSRPPFMPLPLTKPRSISFPNADTSDYENIPAMSSDYENIQIPPRRPARAGTFGEFFDDPSRALSSANENDGYVDMSSFTGFENKPQTTEEETESAYTEAYKVCPVAVGPSEPAGGEDDQGRTSEEEEGGMEHNYDRQIDGRSRAFYIAKELVDSEKEHVKGLKLLQEDFRQTVGAPVGEEGEPALQEDRLNEILSNLPEIYQLHCHILTELEHRIAQWEESQRIADVILSRRAEFSVFALYMAHYDRSAALLEDSCHNSPAFASIARQFELQSPSGRKVPLKQQLLQVIVRMLLYRMLLTDYLNNLSPDSKEYEDTQAALGVVSEVADQANDCLRDGENLLRLVHIEYSVRGQRDLLQPGRVFVKEGTLMKVSRKSRQPRHLFLMNDIMLYTYPQQDGKYRLKNALTLVGMKVSRPLIENVQYALRIEVTDISITLSASSCGEREDWYHTLSHTVEGHARGQGPCRASSSSSSTEAREKVWMSLGETAPTLVPVSQVLMCMNCASDFSLTLRRHHCAACGKIVCRGCSRNKYPLKYLKDRTAKVCDHCYAELKRRGGSVAGASGNDSPRPNRSSRPLSAVFQNIHPPNLWRHRKTTVPLNQVAESPESSSGSGGLHRCKRSKRNWKKLWFLLKDKVPYVSSTPEDKVTSESLPLLGFTVKLPDRPEEEEVTNVFQLYQKKALYYTYREENHTAQRWVNAIEEATVL
ncbi:hypothetical protein COCON_G00144690 [Conger conger]|uniref:FYVE, RhoGEF and PH domain-containing protein 5 n=1 Tax=Conger conger TaxID=82655 RepID=A0A9Q1HVZ0_CONCO|nr:hypothetical protein COCON_G00144690 [Conger conger]